MEPECLKASKKLQIAEAQAKPLPLISICSPIGPLERQEQHWSRVGCTLAIGTLEKHAHH